jgi:hypothetical protein
MAFYSCKPGKIVIPKPENTIPHRALYKPEVPIYSE